MVVDPPRTEFEGEGYYLSYWRNYIASRETLNRDELTALLAYPKQRFALTEIVARLCERRMLTREDAEWLAERMPSDYCAQRHLKVLGVMEDRSAGWRERLAISTALIAPWAVEETLDQVPVSGYQEAMEIIDRSAPGRYDKDLYIRKMTELVSSQIRVDSSFLASHRFETLMALGAEAEIRRLIAELGASGLDELVEKVEETPMGTRLRRRLRGYVHDRRQALG